MFQPSDAQNGMSGGVGGVTGAIPSPPPDQWRGKLQLWIEEGLTQRRRDAEGYKIEGWDSDDWFYGV
ncbi:MAG: hypothetical protein L3J39_16125 [Verrucomicrobiales bacterium]|nr:hypothetical protein [Verrucomicrobiales bacterium]